MSLSKILFDISSHEAFEISSKGRENDDKHSTFNLSKSNSLAL